MKILIGCSMKFRSKVRETLKQMDELGLEGVFPNIDYSDKDKDDAMTISEKKRLALEHYKEMRNVDAVYFILPDGYMGTSTKIELGYALALNKPIYFSEPTHDIALDCYVKKYVTLDKLDIFKKEIL